MVNYSNSIIYKLCCNNTDITAIYIGSTTNFGRRKGQHKCSCNNENDKSHNLQVYQFIRANGDWENWDMVQVEQYEAKDKHDLHARERYWIEQLKPKLNKYIPTRTQREWCEDNKEYFKQYRHDNRERILTKKNNTTKVIKNKYQHITNDTK